MEKSVNVTIQCLMAHKDNPTFASLVKNLPDKCIHCNNSIWDLSTSQSCVCDEHGVKRKRLVLDGYCRRQSKQIYSSDDNKITQSLTCTKYTPLKESGQFDKNDNIIIGKVLPLIAIIIVCVFVYCFSWCMYSLMVLRPADQKIAHDTLAEQSFSAIQPEVTDDHKIDVLPGEDGSHKKVIWMNTKNNNTFVFTVVATADGTMLIY